MGDVRAGSERLAATFPPGRTPRPGCTSSGLGRLPPPTRSGHSPPIQERLIMPRIIVTTDSHQRPDSASVLLDESVRSVHLSTGHAASQLVERLAWAISDAEDEE